MSSVDAAIAPEAFISAETFMIVLDDFSSVMDPLVSLAPLVRLVGSLSIGGCGDFSTGGDLPNFVPSVPVRGRKISFASGSKPPSKIYNISFGLVDLNEKCFPFFPSLFLFS